MPGRTILPETEYEHTPYARPTLAWRREILRETVRAFDRAQPDHFHDLASANVRRWAAQAKTRTPATGVRVIAGDWGEVTRALTQECGTVFAVLNMANAYVPGGAYVEGTAAQEENMFRRTDCHFAIDESELLENGREYRPEISALINGEGGRVLLDTTRPRVCIRGPEIPGTDTGYDWLADDLVFPFYELRAAARDYRDETPFDETDARRRIRAQLDTLIEHSIRHAVLGASGCGAFRNPSETIAQIYRDELHSRQDAFDCVAFAIYHAGYGPGNFIPFSNVFSAD